MRQQPHPHFKRRGADLIVQQEITLEEALIGGKFTLEHLAGKKVTLELDATAAPENVLVAKGLGMPIPGAPGTCGKLYVVAVTKFPKTLPQEKLEKLVEALKGMRPKEEIKSEGKECAVMKDFNPSQKTEREDGEAEGQQREEEGEGEGEGEAHAEGIPCQTQ